MNRMIPILIVASLYATPSSSADLRAEAKELFEEGTALIDRHHHDSMSATKEGLERGIEMVRRATELGYSDLETAYLKLAEALNELAFSYYEYQSEQLGDLAHHRDQIYRRLLELYPSSSEVLYENAFLTEDSEVRKALLRRAVDADPRNAQSSYILGMQLIEEGNFEEGIPMARRGVENSGALVIQSYTDEFLGLLKRLGHYKEARDFEEHLEDLLKMRGP